MQCVSQGLACLGNSTCCHTETEAADKTCYLSQSQYIDTWPTTPSTDSISQGAWWSSHRSANFKVPGLMRPREGSSAKLLVGCSTSQHASVSQGRICTDNNTCCHTETEVADQTFYLTQSQYTDTGPTSPSADPVMSVARQGSHWSVNF